MSTTPTARTGRVLRGAVRWAARLASLGSLLIIGAFVIGEPGVPHGREWLLVACFPIGVSAGLALGWIRPLAGGLLAMASLGGLYVVHAALAAGRVDLGPWFLVLTSPAILFLASAVADGMAASRRDAQGAASEPR